MSKYSFVSEAIAAEIISVLSNDGKRRVSPEVRKMVNSTIKKTFLDAETSLSSGWTDAGKDDAWTRKAGPPPFAMRPLNDNEFRAVVESLGITEDKLPAMAGAQIPLVDGLKEKLSPFAAAPVDKTPAPQMPLPLPAEKEEAPEKENPESGKEAEPNPAVRENMTNKAPVDEFSTNIEKNPGVPGDARIR